MTTARPRGRPPGLPAKWKGLLQEAAAALKNLEEPGKDDATYATAAKLLEEMNQLQEDRRKGGKEFTDGKPVWRKLHSAVMEKSHA